MPGFKLPRLKANLPIVDGKGNPRDYFLRFWNIEVAPTIEQQETNQNDLLAQIQAVQAVQAQQLELINEALELAGIAAGGSSASGIYDVNDSGWTLGPVVNLTGVVAGDLTIQGTGLQSVAGTTTQNKQGTYGGDVRLVEIVGGVDEVLSTSAWRFESTRNEANPASTPYIQNSGFIVGFSESRTSTGDVSYRFDARADSSFALNDVKIYLYVRRST